MKTTYDLLIPPGPVQRLLQVGRIWGPSFALIRLLPRAFSTRGGAEGVWAGDD
jgi:hypothetical protein